MWSQKKKERQSCKTSAAYYPESRYRAKFKSTWSVMRERSKKDSACDLEFESLNNLITAPLGWVRRFPSQHQHTHKDLIFMQGNIKKLSSILLTCMSFIRCLSILQSIPRMSDVQLEENGAFVTGRLNKLLVKPFHACNIRIQLILKLLVTPSPTNFASLFPERSGGTFSR